MGFHRQPDHSAAQPSKAGPSAAQTVVELIRATPRGLILWSRQHLDIAAELQLRVHEDALRGVKAVSVDGWMVVRGFVVECKPARRDDGTVGFEVSIVFDLATPSASLLPRCGSLCAVHGKRSPFGLN